MVWRTPIVDSAARTTSEYRSSWQISTRQPASPTIFTSSRSRSIGLHGTTVAPHFQAASTVSITCGMFCRYIATRSPARTPRRCSATASASDIAST